MAVYFLFMAMPLIVWLIVSLFYNESVNRSDSVKRKYIYICGALIFLMMALRHYSVGSGDGGWYYRSWSIMSELPYSSMRILLSNFDMESGYLFCSWLLAQVFKDPQYIFVFYGLLVAIAVSRFIYLNCEDVVVGMVMFTSLGLWGFMVQGIRQGIAMCICLFAIECCKKRRLVKFLILVSIACLFHASAVVFGVVYCFVFFKMNIKSYALVAVGAVTAMLIIDRLFAIINTIINDAYEVGTIDDTSGGYVTAIIYLLIILLAIIFLKEENLDSPHIAFFFYMTLCGFITFAMRFSINTIVQRVSYYFMFGQIIMLPAVIKRVFVGNGRVLVTMASVLLCLGITAYKAGYSVLVPYIFFWQG